VSERKRGRRGVTGGEGEGREGAAEEGAAACPPAPAPTAAAAAAAGLLLLLLLLALLLVALVRLLLALLLLALVLVLAQLLLVPVLVVDWRGASAHGAGAAGGQPLVHTLHVEHVPALRKLPQHLPLLIVPQAHRAPARQGPTRVCKMYSLSPLYKKNQGPALRKLFFSISPASYSPRHTAHLHQVSTRHKDETVPSLWARWGSGVKGTTVLYRSSTIQYSPVQYCTVLYSLSPCDGDSLGVFVGRVGLRREGHHGEALDEFLEQYVTEPRTSS